MKEHLEKALDDANFLLEDLRAAYSAAGPVEAMLVYDLLKPSADLRNRISEIISAIAAMMVRAEGGDDEKA